MAGFNREIVVYVLAHFPSDVFEELEIDAWKLLLEKPFVPFRTGILRSLLSCDVLPIDRKQK